MITPNTTRRSLLALTLALVAQPTATAGVALPMPPEALPGNYRERVMDVLDRPTLSVASSPQTFRTQIRQYMWMLDHPDRVAKSWRRIGVPALDITTRPDGQFRWRDGKGTELVWRKVAHNKHGLIWYAQGRANPGKLSPTLPGRAVAILWHNSGVDKEGNPVIRHRLDLYIQTESTAANIAARVLGPAAPRLAQDGADQLLMFFSGIARFMHDHPEKAESLFAE